MVENLSNIFKNHEDAALKLLDILPIKQLQEDKYLLLGLSLESISILEVIAKKTGLNYNFLFSEPIYAPNNPECTVAIVSEEEEIIIQDEFVNSFDIKLDYIYGEAHRKYEELILKNIYKYRKGVDDCLYEKQNILLIDEGCEIGNRVLVALKTVINKGAKSVSLAVPVIAEDTAYILNQQIDDIFCVNKIANFVDTKFYYENSQKLSPEVILAILESSKNYLPFQKSQGEDNSHGI